MKKSDVFVSNDYSEKLKNDRLKALAITNAVGNRFPVQCDPVSPGNRSLQTSAYLAGKGCGASSFRCIDTSEVNCRGRSARSVFVRHVDNAPGAAKKTAEEKKPQ